MTYLPAQMYRWFVMQVKWGAIASASLVSSHLLVAAALPGWAQITPDGTLGAEGSIVTEGVEVRGALADLIEGGAIRDANLFHSFLEFNVNEGQRVYFANPDAIANIFSRVTGADPSDILGTLGVDGAANLFFLNPNGIGFGPNASLNIEGSFVGSTAESFVFPDGSTFSATNPDDANLLTVSVPLGLQYGPNPPGSTVVNRGAIATGQDLTLTADILDLQGQLFAGGDLTLRAIDTLQIRDAVDTPFVAASVGEMLVQGDRTVDIFALNHPESGLFSGGNMTLRSANPVGGDAHYYSVGTFRIEQIDSTLGELYSPHDPIILSLSDVEFDAYLGSSLHIIAAGSVTIPGFIRIIGADAQAGLFQTLTLSNGEAITINGTAEPTLDIRAGVDPDFIGSPALFGVGVFFNPFPVVDVPSFSDFSTSADITVGPILFLDDTTGIPTLISGRVLLTNQYQPNLLLAGGDITLSTAPQANAIVVMSCLVSIDSRGDIQIRGNTQTNGGIVVSALQNDSIFSADGGSVTLLADGNINLEPGTLIVSQGLVGGDISLVSQENISIKRALIGSGNNSNEVDASNGAIRITALGSLALEESSGIASDTFGRIDAGDIEINAETGSISIDGSSITSVSRGAGGGGNINLQAAGFIRIGGLDSEGFPSLISSGTLEEATSDAGNISFESDSLVIEDGASVNALYSGTGGNAGNITIRVQEDFLLRKDSNIESGVASIDGGNAGMINLLAANVLISGGSNISAANSGQGNGGNINIMARNDVVFDGLNDTGQFILDTLPTGVTTSTLPGTVGEAGDINITTRSLQVVNGASLLSVQGGIGEAGDININAQNTVLVEGEADAFVEFEGEIVGFQSSILASTGDRAVGSGGNINITANSVSVTNGGNLGTVTNGLGDSGNISITVEDAATFDGFGRFSGLPTLIS
ncbi:MAG: filamentous hemagglutinin N-terminal domain-containing protein, partial [Elainellaceae cyanobacterium]